jgi:hypothetical protein
MFVMYRIFTSGNVITFEVVFPKVPKERPEMLRLHTSLACQTTFLGN